jgi:tripartite-type tricarboxylate transporter receptor subunit TctC
MQRRSFSRTLCIGLGCLLAIALPDASQAQSTTSDYPNKPIRIVVPFPPGGSSDAVMRLLVPRLSERLGQPVIIENRPGAGGNIGLAIVAKAPADGYTLGLGAAGGLAANVSLYPQLPYDPVKDFKGISMLAGIPFVLIAHPSSVAKTMQGLIAQAKAAPGKIAIGHGGNGTAMHLSSQLFAQMANLQVVDVSYKGSGPATVDVLGGQIPYAMVDLTSALPHVKTGKLIAIGVTSEKRLTMLPEVPTFNESGVIGYESTGWFGVVAPQGTTNSQVAKLHAELTAALNDVELRKSMLNMGVEPSPTKPEEFEQIIKSEIVKWARVIKTAGTKLE